MRLAAHGGGPEPAQRRRGDGRRRARGEPEAAAERDRRGGDSPRVHPLQPRQPVPLGSHLRRAGRNQSDRPRALDSRFLLIFEVL